MYVFVISMRYLSKLRTYFFALDYDSFKYVLKD